MFLHYWTTLLLEWWYLVYQDICHRHKNYKILEDKTPTCWGHCSRTHPWCNKQAFWLNPSFSMHFSPVKLFSTNQNYFFTSQGSCCISEVPNHWAVDQYRAVDYLVPGRKEENRSRISVFCLSADSKIKVCRLSHCLLTVETWWCDIYPARKCLPTCWLKWVKNKRAQRTSLKIGKRPNYESAENLKTVKKKKVEFSRKYQKSNFYFGKNRHIPCSRSQTPVCVNTAWQKPVCVAKKVGDRYCRWQQNQQFWDCFMVDNVKYNMFAKQ